jgi:uncharacterized protein (DUF58 family)
LAGVRDYKPGDSVRHIHWKATARRGTLQTKQFDPNAAQQLLICLNMQSLENHYGGILVNELETAIVAAASLAHAALDSRIPVGLLSNASLRDTEGLTRLPASRHNQHEQRLLEILAQITYFTNVHFDQLLRAEAPSLPYGTTLIIITTLLTDSLQTQLLNLRRAGHPVAIILVDTRLSRQPSALGATNTQSPNLPFSFSPLLPIYTLTQNWTDLEALKLD